MPMSLGSGKLSQPRRAKGDRTVKCHVGPEGLQRQRMLGKHRGSGTSVKTIEMSLCCPASTSWSSNQLEPANAGCSLAALCPCRCSTPTTASSGRTNGDKSSCFLCQKSGGGCIFNLFSKPRNFKNLPRQILNHVYTWK